MHHTCRGIHSYDSPCYSSKFQKLWDVDQDREGDRRQEIVEGSLLQNRSRIGANVSSRSVIGAVVVTSRAHGLEPALLSHHKRVTDGHVSASRVARLNF